MPHLNGETESGSTESWLMARISVFFRMLRVSFVIEDSCSTESHLIVRIGCWRGRTFVPISNGDFINCGRESDQYLQLGEASEDPYRPSSKMSFGLIEGHVTVSAARTRPSIIGVWMKSFIRYLQLKLVGAGFHQGPVSLCEREEFSRTISISFRP